MTEVLNDVNAPSDAELISRVRGGDAPAYGELFARHVGAANRLSRQLVRGPDADDLVSEAFAKVLSVLQGGGGPDVAFRAYLLTALRRLHVDRVRAASRVQPSDDMEAFDPGIPFRDTAVAAFESSAAARAFASLPERWQMVLWHLEVEGQKPADIAPLLGMSANSVSALAYRAREGLRQAFLTMHLHDMSEATCRWTTEHLGAYVRQGLSARDTTKVQGHLDGCRRCTAMHLELTEVNANLRGIIAPLLLGAAATGYLTSSGGSLAGAGVLGVLGRFRDVVAANGTAATVTGVAAGVAAVAAAGAMLVAQAPQTVVAGPGEITASDPVAPASPPWADSLRARDGERAPREGGAQASAPASRGSADAPGASDAPDAMAATGATPRRDLGAPSSPESVALATEAPSPLPSPLPSDQPIDPTEEVTAAPTADPTDGPTTDPTSSPTGEPTTGPTPDGPTPDGPTTDPTDGPTTDPTSGPTSGPTDGPTGGPTSGPTDGPTSGPTSGPTDGLTEGPTDPTGEPTDPPKRPTSMTPGTAALTDGRLRVELTGDPLPDAVQLRVISDFGATFGDDGTCTPDARDRTGAHCQTSAHPPVATASFARAIGIADGTTSFLVDMPLEGRPAVDSDVLVEIRDATGDSLHTLTLRYDVDEELPAADVALTTPMSEVTAGPNGVHEVPLRLSLPEGYSGPTRLAVSTSDGSDLAALGTPTTGCTATADSLTCSGAVTDVTLWVRLADPDVATTLRVALDPLDGLLDPDLADNGVTLELLPRSPQPPAETDLTVAVETDLDGNAGKGSVEVAVSTAPGRPQPGRVVLELLHSPAQLELTGLPPGCAPVPTGLSCDLTAAEAAAVGVDVALAGRPHASGTAVLVIRASAPGFTELTPADNERAVTVTRRVGGGRAGRAPGGAATGTSEPTRATEPARTTLTSGPSGPSGPSATAASVEQAAPADSAEASPDAPSRPGTPASPGRPAPDGGDSTESRPGAPATPEQPTSNPPVGEDRGRSPGSPGSPATPTPTSTSTPAHSTPTPTPTPVATITPKDRSAAGPRTLRSVGRPTA